MKLLKDICGTFCDGLAMREIPIGYAIKTPFRDADGDAVAIYLRRDPTNPSLHRLEDDGATIADLQEGGASLDNEQRETAFLALLSEHGCLYDEAEEIIHTEYVTEDQTPAHFLKFMALMIRIADLKLLSRERVRDTFKADLQDLVEEAFAGIATVQRDAPAQAALRDYVADVVVTTPSATLAIFAGTTEVKALEALVLWQELERQGIVGIVPFVVLETAKPAHIKSRTMARVFNSEVQLASMDGSKWDLTQKLRSKAGVTVATH